MSKRLGIASSAISSNSKGAKKDANSRRAFTLIELMVVLAIIGILASLLLPALCRAKTTAESVVCKNNLRQYAFALNAYVSDSGGKYPMSDGKIGQSGPYLSRPALQFCPAAKRFNAKSMRRASLPVFASRSGYQFNREGTGPDYSDIDTVHCLGLGGTFGWDSRFGRVIEKPLPESAVRSPSDMIAFTHFVTTGYGCGAYTARMGFGWPGVPQDPVTSAPFHPGGENAAFCDGHVESESSAGIPQWSYGGFKPDVLHARRWNYDNLPHQETWLEY